MHQCSVLFTHPWYHRSQVRQIFIEAPGVIIFKQVGVSFVLKLEERRKALYCTEVVHFARTMKTKLATQN